MCGSFTTDPATQELTRLGLAELSGADFGAAQTPARDSEPDGSVEGARRERFAEAAARANGWRR